MQVLGVACALRVHKSFLILTHGRATPPTQLGKAALNDPAIWQQHKALFHLRQLDHLQLNAVLRRIAASQLARIALVCPRELDNVPGRFLHLLA